MKSALLVLLVCMLAWSFAPAQVPRTLSYQGVLTDSLGNAKSDGTYSFTFRLYDVSTGGGALWTDTKDLYVARGLFTTMLGDKIPFGPSITFDRKYWLGVTLEPGAELSPRAELSSSAYSLRAQQADSAGIAGTVPDGTVTASKIPAGQVVKGVNSIKDNVTLAAGANVNIARAGDTLKISATPGGTGDITGLTAGKGLTGGGLSGDVTLALDTTYADSRFVNENQPLSVSQAMLAGGAVNSGKIANGNVVRSIDGLTDFVTLSPGVGTTITGSGSTLTVSAPRLIKRLNTQSLINLSPDGTRVYSILAQINSPLAGVVIVMVELRFVQTIAPPGGGGAWSGFYVTTSSVPPTASTVPMNQSAVGDINTTGSWNQFRIYDFSVAANTTYYVYLSGQVRNGGSGVSSPAFWDVQCTMMHFTGDVL